MVATWQVKRRRTELFPQEKLQDAVAGIAEILATTRDGDLDVAAGTDLVRHVRTLAMGASLLGGRPDDDLVGMLEETERLLDRPAMSGIYNVATARALLPRLRVGQRITEAEAQFRLAVPPPTGPRAEVTRPPKDLTVLLASVAAALEVVAILAAVTGVIIGIWVASRPEASQNVSGSTHPFVAAGLGIAVLSIILGAFFWVLMRAARVTADMAQRGT